MPRSGETVPKSTQCPSDLKTLQLVPLWVIAAGLICAFGIWFTPSLLVVYVGLTATFDWQSLLGYLALSALSASCLRLLMGGLLQSVDDVANLFALLMTLIALCLAFLFWALPLSANQLPWIALCAGLGGGMVGQCGPPLAARLTTRHQLETTTLLGHLGIVGGLMLMPWLVTQALPIASSQVLLRDASHFLGRVVAGTQVNFSWFALWWGGLCGLTLAAWLLRARGQLLAVWRSAVRIVGILCVGMFLAWGGAVLLQWLPAVRFVWLLPLALTLVLCVGVVKGLVADYRWRSMATLLGYRHLWVMGAAWMTTMGTFLGLTLCFPILTAALFSQPIDTRASPDYPSVFLYAWMLPLAALLVRPLGHWAARRFGGIKVSLLCLLIMALAALGAARTSFLASQMSYAPYYFTGYLASCALLCIASGLAHAALVHALPAIFPPLLRQNASAWLMTMATVGMTGVILLFAQEQPAGYHRAFILLAVSYGVCALLNGYLYLRRRAFIFSP